VDLVLRLGIAKYTDQVGKIWNSLARWWILKGEWDRARDVYEEALVSVSTVRDFSLVFDTFAKMEEDLLAMQMQELETDQEVDFDETDLDMGLARFERLMQRRPFLLNDVVLRQNPHNVVEWQNRVNLWKERENKEKVVETFEIASRMMNGRKATNGYVGFWISFSNTFIEYQDLEKARQVYERAVKAAFKSVEDLVEIWCSYAEMEIAQSDAQKALDVLSRACIIPRLPPAQLSAIRFNDDSKDPHQRLFKSIKLWSFLVDLHESVGTVESTRNVYDKVLNLKIANPQIVINYASFLEEHSFFEEVCVFYTNFFRALESMSVVLKCLDIPLHLISGIFTWTSL
jgi:pre-mRNA-splicing factor SYF1